MQGVIVKAIMFAIFCSLISLAIHILVSFFRKGRSESGLPVFELLNQAKIISFVWLILFLLYIGLYFLTPSNFFIFDKFTIVIERSAFISGIIFYLLLSFIYITIYYFFDRSISGTILELIDNTKKREMTLGELKQKYSVDIKYNT